jgi:hypothetical protein
MIIRHTLVNTTARLVGTAIVFAMAQSAAADGPIDIGSRRELFVDRFMIDRMDGARLKMHEPRLAPRGANPRPNGHYATVLKDGDLFRFYYRGDKRGTSSWTRGWSSATTSHPSSTPAPACPPTRSTRPSAA